MKEGTAEARHGNISRSSMRREEEAEVFSARPAERGERNLRIMGAS